VRRVALAERKKMRFEILNFRFQMKATAEVTASPTLSPRTAPASRGL
jgi:hypothetical protein